MNLLRFSVRPQARLNTTANIQNCLTLVFHLARNRMVKKQKQKKQTAGAKTVKLVHGAPSNTPPAVNFRGPVQQTIKSTHGMVNPFGTHARGCKIPDDDSTPSVAIQVTCTGVLDSDASGRVLANFTPGLQNIGDEWNSGGSPVAATTKKATIVNPDYAQLASNFSAYRIVSWGVRVYSIIAPTVATGQVRFITSNTYITTGDVYTGNLFQQVSNFPVYDSDIYWISTPRGTTWKEYVPLTTSSNWTHLVIYADALPNTTKSLSFEFVMNIECIVKYATLSATIATPAADSDQAAMVATSKAHSRKKDANHSKVLGTIGDITLAALSDVFSYVAPSVGRKLLSYIGGKPKAAQYTIVD